MSDPIVDVLRAHQWNDLTAGCSCGWTARDGLGQRYARRQSHPVHVADRLHTEAAPIVTADELHPHILGSLPHGIRDEEMVARNVAIGVAMHLEFRHSHAEETSR